MRKSHLLTCFLLVAFNSINSQFLSKKQIEKAASEKFVTATYKLKEFLEIPNDGNFTEHIENNLNWCNTAFKSLDFNTKVLTTEGAPLLFAEKKFHDNARTVLFYLQIDGQPVDKNKWKQKDPFTPVLKKKTEAGTWQKINFKQESAFDLDWRIFARSASDSKGPAISFISALEIFKDEGWKPAYNLKVIMDFQEELGSPHLAKAVTIYKDLLQTEMLFIMDGTRHVSNLPTLTYGARGIATATLKIFGPTYPLHSGQYGNFAPNPVFKAAKLISSLKDDNGRVTIPGFYDGIDLSDKDKTIMNKLPEDITTIKKRLGVARKDSIGNTYQESLQYPSLNIRGLKSAWVGKEARTIIPSEVIVEIDMRLVPETDGIRQMQLLKKHIESSGYHLVDSIPTENERNTYPKIASFNYRLGSLPFRTNLDSPIGAMANRAFNRVFGANFINMRTTGGSQPISAFIKTLKTSAISIRIPNPDNNIHGPNENLRLGNFMEGIQSCLAILSEPIIDTTK